MNVTLRVTNRQAKEKEITAGLHTEMRVTELTVRGLKRKAFRKETAGRRQTETGGKRRP